MSEAPRLLRISGPDQDLVEALREWTAMAERGEIVGAVLLANRPGAVLHRTAGVMPLETAFFAFEWFKRRQMDGAGG